MCLQKEAVCVVVKALATNTELPPLPTEILDLIFSSLDNVKDLVALTATCTTWRRLYMMLDVLGEIIT